MSSEQPRDTWQVGSIKDARGRAVRQLDPVLMHAAGRHDVIPSDALKAIAREVGVGLTRANRLLLWSSVAGVVCLAIALTILSVRLSRGSISGGRFMRNLVPYGAIWLAPYGLWMGTRGVRHQRIARIMLQHLRCPHCGYDLRGLPSDETDSTTVCPECGCAWVVPGESQNGIAG